MKYRPEIDGLRAIAVISVIFFHAGFGWMAGGYVGVDIFFVISGYLITSIIVTDLQNGTFKFLNFYERRARRILPALFLVAFTCIPFAWMWLSPRDMKEFGESLLGIATFSSNYVFFSQSGYFETATEIKPLLHTWSLAIEEQFYVIFPVVMILIHYFCRRRFFIYLLIIAICSISIAEWQLRYAPSLAYYMMWTRSWELLAGALCAITLTNSSIRVSKITREIGAGLGLCMIFFAAFTFSNGTPMPGLSALLPVIGTILIIVLCDKTCGVGKVLAFPALVAIGLMSYSMYLWHQPIFAFARYRLFDDVSSSLMLLLCALTIVLAYASWRFVESPFRNRMLVSRTAIFSGGTVASLLAIFIGAVSLVTSGFEGRFPQYASNISLADITGIRIIDEIRTTIPLYETSIMRESSRILPTESTPTGKILVIGDSHASSLEGFFSEIAKEYFLDVKLHVLQGCPPIFGAKVFYGITKGHQQRSEICWSQNKDWATLIQTHKADLDAVVLAARWNFLLDQPQYLTNDLPRRYLYFSNPETEARINSTDPSYDVLDTSLGDTILFINNLGLKVILVSQAPHLTFDAGRCRFEVFPRCGEPTYDAVVNRQMKMDLFVEGISNTIESTQFFHVRLIDYLCNESTKRCPVHVDNQILYLDTNHLSFSGAAYIAREFIRALPQNPFLLGN